MRYLALLTGTTIGMIAWAGLVSPLAGMQEDPGDGEDEGFQSPWTDDYCADRAYVIPLVKHAFISVPGEEGRGGDHTPWESGVRQQRWMSFH